MLTIHCIINENTAETVFSGGLNECSLHVRTLMPKYPGVTFVICKLVPVSTHTGPPSTIPANYPFGIVRPSLPC